ncbi:MAG: phosphoribosyltransferase [Candidatus Korarchaeota archaeon]|nr:phosphoribosyltransferase [Candidatus Korarchaeota archaeon]NIU83444.1 phosphoribosyltransferase [Candidatus Thorarchaeota archaeon]NIW13720.1 phosphoribosyltransferase [Candidatus Thorarchaeota archaeon]NIW51815.1 phosphoribosyltransferase [Candidatus Korarchaeota archaeon]
MVELEQKLTKIVSLEEVRQMSIATARKIRDTDFEPDIIVGLSRGGWIPARLICDYLLVPDLVSMEVTHWGLPAEIGQEEAQLEHPFEVDLTGKNVLIVDDITDTGESLELALNVVNKQDPNGVKTATMQYITGSSIEPDFYTEKVDEWVWFLYPWCWMEDLTGFVERIMKSQKEQSWSVDAINTMLKKYHEISVPEEELKEIVGTLEDQSKIVKKGKTWTWSDKQ